MTIRNNVTTQSIDPASLGKRMLIGAGIALLLISLFLSSADEPDPSWPKLWMLRPLIIVPFAGAMGGLFNYFIHHRRKQKRNKAMVNLLSITVYIIGFWMGFVLGLDGTMWN